MSEKNPHLPEARSDEAWDEYVRRVNKERKRALEKGKTKRANKLRRFLFDTKWNQ